jgi:hypothetical protein
MTQTQTTPGGHCSWGSDPQEFAERLHEVLEQSR